MARIPDLSVVVVVHNMPREAARTLLSLSAGYQRDIDADDYEVIVVDNGSDPPFDPAVIAALPGHFRLIRLDPAPPSPARAINCGLAAARGQVVGAMIDGARIVTPGLLHFARHGARLYPRAIVVSLGWYLGADFQGWASEAGYDAPQEDALLDAIHWPQDGYRLFEVSTLCESSLGGWLSDLHDSSEGLAESNALFMSRESWDLLHGFDERFDGPGGGFVNLDAYRRALELTGARLVILLGEGTFHQLHGGIGTNASPEIVRKRLRDWMLQYHAIRQQRWADPKATDPPAYLGTLPRAALVRFVRAAIDPIRRSRLQPVGPSFDLWSWPDPPASPPADPAVAALVELMQVEFRAGRYDAVAAIARIARRRAPEEPEPLRLLRLVAPYDDVREWKSAVRSARFHLAVGQAYRLTGDHGNAAHAFHAALRLEPDLAEAHAGLAALTSPAPDRPR